jgi:hypothetical protein
MQELNLVHPTAIDPRTGQRIRAIGIMPSGRIVWPIAGGDPSNDPPETDPAKTDPPATDPANADPAKTDPPATDPAKAEPVDESSMTPEQLRAELAKTRREAAGYRTKVRELEPKAKKLDELTEAEKSEVQRANDRAAAAERRATELEAAQLRTSVAAAKKLPASLAARLQGSTKEELEADADALLADLGSKVTEEKPPAGDGDGGTRTPAGEKNLEDASMDDFVGMFATPKK